MWFFVKPSSVLYMIFADLFGANMSLDEEISSKAKITRYNKAKYFKSKCQLSLLHYYTYISKLKL